MLQRVTAFQSAFWKFLRPHTIRGTILGSISVTARALIECPIVGPQIKGVGILVAELNLEIVTAS